MLAFLFAVASLSAVLAYGGSSMQAFEARKVERSEALRLSLLVALLGDAGDLRSLRDCSRHPRCLNTLLNG